MENRHVFNFIFCPTINKTVSIYDRFITSLLTVDVKRVTRTREVLNSIIPEETFMEMDRIVGASCKGNYPVLRPINRISEDICEEIENRLDLILRPDTTATDGINTCSLYVPSINTYKKLCDKLIKGLVCGKDESETYVLS